MDSARDAVLPLMLAPATVYKELLYRPAGELSTWIGARFEILARPGFLLRHPPSPGDVLLRVTPGEPGGGECVVLPAGRPAADTPRRLAPGHLILRPRAAATSEEEAEPNAVLSCPQFAGDTDLVEVLAGRLVLAAPGTPSHQRAPVRSAGPAVQKVQRALVANGYRLPSGADGDFGPETARAVAQFNTTHGIGPGDPAVGAETVAALDGACRNQLSAKESAYRVAASGRNTGQPRSDPRPAIVPPLAHYGPSPGAVKVAVVGGGFAGLMSAWSLLPHLFDVTVFEARSQLGGRVRTDRTMISGQLVEAGAELIGENHPMWIRLAAQFGLHLEPISTHDDYERMRPKLRTRVILGGHELSAKELKDIDTKLDKVLTLMGEEAKTVLPLQPWTAASAAKWDAMSVAQRLDEADMFGRTSDPSDLARRYLEFTIENDNCVPVDRHSYLALLCAISAGRIGTNMLGYWTHTETHRCAGGNDQIATRLAADITDIRLNSPVDAITVGEANGITYRGPDGEHHETFDYVILAGPPTAWPPITSTPAFDPAMFAVSQGPAVKFIGSFATEFWKKHGLAPVTRSDEVGNVWEATDKQKSPSGFGLTAYSGGRFVLDAATYRRRLDALYPGYTKGLLSAQLVDWPNEPFIKTGYAAPRVGDVTTVMKNLNGSFRDRIFFAGEHVSPGFFGYMEGALQSGLFAAYRVAVAARNSGRLIPAKPQTSFVPVPVAP